ncbi:MAG TPA: rRNA methyltransferase [Chloroflexi bacterium]|jgi:TrmH family RNA methyltransferase|nr:rRNA methyltransferase [Chloroflexota bacterium]
MRNQPSSATPRVVQIHSANNHFQHAEVLRRNRHKRQHYKEFFLEGVRPINLAIQHGWGIVAYYYSPERGLSDWAKNILRQSPAPTHFELSTQLLAELSGKAEPSELIALLAMPDDDLQRIEATSDLLVIVFDRPSNPGNLGTLIRSCDAMGVNGLILTGHGADLYDPETISASRGSIFALPVIRVGGPRDLESWLSAVRQEAGSVQIVAADEEAGVDLWKHDFSGPTALLLGTEKWGLSAAYKEMAEAFVRIPMHGAASSLNVAVAASIVLYEVERQRQGMRATKGPD